MWYFLTGSNSKLLSGELATHLSGRYVSFKIMPFSFIEMCELKGLSKNDTHDNHFMEYLNYGGMPQRFLMQSETETKVYLRDVYNSIVLKDIVQRSKIKDVDILNRKVSTETIYGYIEYISSSLIMNKAVRYDIRGKRILTRSDKYYLTDLGFSKINNTGFKTEIGALIENVIYNEFIHRGYEVYVGKISKGEIDFVTMDGEKRSYYQVAYLLVNVNLEHLIT